jgi:hypothetical protein
VIVAVIGLFVRVAFIRAICVIAAYAWCTYGIILNDNDESIVFVYHCKASVGFLSESGLERRKVLAVYPICLFYFALGWMILIS